MNNIVLYKYISSPQNSHVMEKWICVTQNARFSDSIGTSSNEDKYFQLENYVFIYIYVVYVSLIAYIF